MILWFYCLHNNNDNFSDFFYKKCVFFYCLGQFYYFNCLENNCDNNFNCHGHGNNGSIRMNFQ